MTGASEQIRAVLEELLLEISDHLWAAYSADPTKIWAAELSTLLVGLVEPEDDADYDA